MARWQINLECLETFLHTSLHGYRFAFEFRDNGWFVPTTYKMLTTHHMAFYLYNVTGQWPSETITADFIYLRLYGPAGPFQGQY